MREAIARAIADDPPALATDPGIIRAGFDAALDELRNLSRTSKQTIAAMEERERKRTGIASLKIRFNQVFGYYIEISNANRRSRPRRLRPQANAGRRRAFYLARAEGIRAQSSRRRRAHPRNRAPPLRRTARANRARSPTPAPHRRGDRATRRAGKFRAPGRLRKLHAAHFHRRATRRARRITDRRRPPSGDRAAALLTRRALRAQRSLSRRQNAISSC